MNAPNPEQIERTRFEKQLQDHMTRLVVKVDVRIEVQSSDTGLFAAN